MNKLERIEVINILIGFIGFIMMAYGAIAFDDHKLLCLAIALTGIVISTLSWGSIIEIEEDWED